MRTQLARTIINLSRGKPAGFIITPRELLHLASRAVIDQTLSRLVKEEKIYRLCRGYYTYPVKKGSSRFLGYYAPSTHDFMKAWMEKTGEKLVTHGAAAANYLHIDTQVSMGLILLTSGPSRKINLGGCIIELRHTPNWLLMYDETPEGWLLRALVSYSPSVYDSLLSKVKRLPNIDWEKITKISSMFPSYLLNFIHRVIYG